MDDREKLAALEAAVRKIVEAMVDYLKPEVKFTQEEFVKATILAVDTSAVHDALQSEAPRLDHSSAD